MTTSTAGNGTRTQSPALSAAYLVGILCVTNAVAFIDRQMLVLLVDPIKLSVGLSDTQIGLLQGPAFALFYAVVGLYLGHLVDRTHRIRLLLAGLVLWSIMTVLFAFADGFWPMFLVRMGVGVGEAVLTPVAASLIADRVDASWRARAMSIFVMGNSLGAGAAMIGGGAFVAWATAAAAGAQIWGLEPWQWTFIGCGALSVPLLLLILPIREPPRRSLPVAPLAPSGGQDRIRASWRVHGGVILAFSLAGVVGFGAGSWMPTVIARSFDLAPGVVGPTYGVILLATAPFGVLCGGMLADRLRKAGHADANILVGMLGTACLCLGVVATCNAPSLSAAWALAGFYSFFATFPFGVAYAALTEITPGGARGRVVAIYALGLNVFGFGLGPTTAGFLTDYIFADPKAIGLSLSVTALLFTGPALLSFMLLRKPYRHLTAAG